MFCFILQIENLICHTYPKVYKIHNKIIYIRRNDEKVVSSNEARSTFNGCMTRAISINLYYVSHGESEI